LYGDLTVVTKNKKQQKSRNCGGVEFKGIINVGRQSMGNKKA